MKVVAIINEKGGTAKTTTTVNLAAALGEIGQSVLVVDLDGQAASSRWLGVEGDSRLADALIAGEGLEPIRGVLPNVDLAPASGKIDSVAHELRPTQGGQLRRVLADVQTRYPYDYVLLDCPPSLGNRLIGNALLAATHALVPVEASILALDGLRILLTMLKDIRQGFDHNIELLGVLACRYDARTRLSRLVLSELHRALPNNVFRTVIHNTIRIQECPAVCKSIFEYAPDCPAAKDYRMLAQELTTGEVDGERVEEVEDIISSEEIDHSDRQTVLDFRRRAAEFFGRTAAEEEPTTVSSSREGEKETDMVVEVVMEETGEDVSPSAAVSHEPAPCVEDAVDEALVAAAAPSPAPEPPAPRASPPPLPPAGKPPAPTPVRGDATHAKARRGAKLVAAGVVLFFAVGAIVVQQTRLLPYRAEANHAEEAIPADDTAAAVVVKPVLATEEKTVSSRLPKGDKELTLEIWEDAEEEQLLSEIEKDLPTAVSPPPAASAEKISVPGGKTSEPVSTVTLSSANASSSAEQAGLAGPPDGKPLSPTKQPESLPASPAAGPPVTAKPVSPPSPEKRETAKKRSLPEPITLTFSGMMRFQGEDTASINDRWLRVGERIHGAKIVAIDPMFAEVEWQKERFRLRMGEETTLHVGEGQPAE